MPTLRVAIDRMEREIEKLSEHVVSLHTLMENRVTAVEVYFKQATDTSNRWFNQTWPEHLRLHETLAEGVTKTLKETNELVELKHKSQNGTIDTLRREIEEKIAPLQQAFQQGRGAAWALRLTFGLLMAAIGFITRHFLGH